MAGQCLQCDLVLYNDLHFLLGYNLLRVDCECCSMFMHYNVGMFMLLNLFLTAGVLAGMWPCGVVIMLTELFTAESLSQVYAAIHELFTNHSTITENLSE